MKRLPILILAAALCCFSAFAGEELKPVTLKKGEIVAYVEVEGGSEDRVPVGPEEDWELLCPDGDWHKAEIEILQDSVVAMVQKGETLGFLYAWDRDGNEVTVGLVALKDIESSFSAFFSKFGIYIMSLLIVLMVVLFLYLKYHKEDTAWTRGQRYKKQEARQQAKKERKAKKG